MYQEYAFSDLAELVIFSLMKEEEIVQQMVFDGEIVKETVRNGERESSIGGKDDLLGENNYTFKHLFAMTVSELTFCMTLIETQ